MTPAVLLDLDGTLTDPRPGIVGCIRYALDRLARPCPADDALAAYIGPPLRGAFAALLPSADRMLIERAVELYRERFADVGLYENEVYEGVPAMLEALGHAGRRLFVATSKPAAFAERIVRHFALDHHLAGVYGPGLDGRLEDKAQLLGHLLEAERLAAAAAIMVGDRAADVAAARANGVRVIGVLWGYGSRDELLGAGADALCASPPELPAAITRLLGDRPFSAAAASDRSPATPRRAGPASPAAG